MYVRIIVISKVKSFIDFICYLEESLSNLLPHHTGWDHLICLPKRLYTQQVYSLYAKYLQSRFSSLNLRLLLKLLIKQVQLSNLQMKQEKLYRVYPKLLFMPEIARTFFLFEGFCSLLLKLKRIISKFFLLIYLSNAIFFKYILRLKTSVTSSNILRV